MKTVKNFAFALVVIATISVSVIPIVARAQLQSQPPGGLPFGGFIGTYVAPNPSCFVGHTVLYDFVRSRLIGIAQIPTSQIYLNRNLITPGTAVLGTILPTPIPCLVPYTIYPIIQAGTS